MKKAVKTKEDDAFKSEVVKYQVQNNEETDDSETESIRLRNSYLDLDSPLCFEETDEDQNSQLLSSFDHLRLFHSASEKKRHELQIVKPTTMESIICDQTSTTDSEKSMLGKTTIYVRVTFQ